MAQPKAVRNQVKDRPALPNPFAVSDILTFDWSNDTRNCVRLPRLFLKHALSNIKRNTEMLEEKKENRIQKRIKTLKAGQIVFYHNNCLVKCLVRDLSDNGAKLETEIAIDCPDNFKLLLLDGPTYDCFVAWRKANLIGVRFANQ